MELRNSGGFVSVVGRSGVGECGGVGGNGQSLPYLLYMRRKAVTIAVRKGASARPKPPGASGAVGSWDNGELAGWLDCRRHEIRNSLALVPERLSLEILSYT